MHDEVREELKRIVSIHGRCICHDPEEFKSVIEKACPTCKREVELLIKALEDRVPGRLLALPNGMPWESVTAPLIPKLMNDLNITEDEARWTVDSWGLALLKVHQKELDESHKPPEPVLIGGNESKKPGSGSSIWKWFTRSK
jgi:hypothetical protein